MGRLKMDEELDNKKETTTTKRKSAVKKEILIQGLFPCGVNGCTKQFAREADLKRHRKTAKLHAMGGFACSQCEATFTRTDALRRHQKSRHSGNAFHDSAEPEEPSRSSSTAPSSSNGKDKEIDRMVMPEIVQGAPSASGPATGHSSYYLQHTSAISYAAPARTVVGAGWRNGHTWPNRSSPPPLGPTTYMYVPSPHYRHGTPGTSSQRQHSTGPASTSPHPKSHLASPSSSSASSPHSQRNDHDEPTSPPEASSVPQTQAPIPPLPPPVQIGRLLLEADAARTAERSSSEHQCTQERFPSEGFSTAMKQSRSWSISDDGMSELGDFNRDISASSSSQSSPTTSPSSHIMREHGYGSRLKRPEPMEPILTENGETMLNPAELLTQESLASPEPS